MNELTTMEVRDVAVRTPETIAAEINLINKQAKETILSAAIEIGRRLCEAKELVRHGEWEDWLSENVNYSQSTANNLMAVFWEYGSDQQSLFDRASSRSIEDLTYSKAVALLTLPREQREEFMEEHPVEDMSTRELQEAIRKAKEAESQLSTAIEERQKYQDIAHKEMNRSRKYSEEAKKAAADLEKAKAAKKRSDEKVKSLQQQIENLQSMEKQLDQPTLDAATAEVAERLRAENAEKLRELEEKLSAANSEKEQITKRLAAAGNECMIRAKVIVAQLQEQFNQLRKLITELEAQGDSENAAKLSVATKKLCEEMGKRV